MILKHILWVGFGGAIGSILRYLVSYFTYAKAGKEYLTFPWPTFIVNLFGCLLIGLLVGLSQKHVSFDDQLKLFLITGFCGGFTTFSAFSLENMQMYQSGHYLTLGLYVLSSVLLGILLVWLGMIFVK